MARMLRGRISDERGFTLIELMVVILIIGILTAIVLTTFVGHKDRSEDAQAKSNARNLVTQVESCFAVNTNYNRCDTLAELENAGGIPWGNGPGQARVRASNARSYEIESISVSRLGGTQHVFTIAKNVNSGVITKTCVPAGKGGCPATGVW